MLARALRRYGVISVGAAGTFVVRAPASQAELREAFREELPFVSAITICKGSEFLAVAADRFFVGKAPRVDLVRFLCVLGKRPRVTPFLPFSLPSKEEWLVRVLVTRGRFVFGHYRRHMRTIGCLGALDDVFGVPVTTRNWRTLAAVREVLRLE
jgi:hypothetical protein